MPVIRQMLLVLVVEISLTAAGRLEASEVDALFETSSSNEQVITNIAVYCCS